MLRVPGKLSLRCFNLDTLISTVRKTVPISKW